MIIEHRGWPRLCSPSPQPSGFPSPPPASFPRGDERFALCGPLGRGSSCLARSSQPERSRVHRCGKSFLPFHEPWVFPDRPLTPAQWLPKPATSQFPHTRRTLRVTWSPDGGEGEDCGRRAVQGFKARKFFSANSHPGPVASQARHQSVSPKEPNASRYVVPWGEGEASATVVAIQGGWIGASAAKGSTLSSGRGLG
jgi:hypothetical protein